VKASFGTALKLYDKKHPGHSIAMALATVAAFMLTPPTKTFLDGMRSREVWAGLHQRLLPKDRWFGIVSLRGRLAWGDTPVVPADATAAPADVQEKGDAPASGLSTGSIGVAPKQSE
jgi:hypothetical protein